jgi:hypothetical protein
MSTSIEQIYSDLVSIWNSPDSYVSKTKSSISSEMLQHKLISLIKEKNNIDNDIISDFSAIFDAIFTQLEINIDCSDIGKYLHEYMKFSQIPCSHFVDNTNLCSHYNENDKIPISIIFQSMSCKSCGILRDLHSPCKKYHVTNKKNCENDEGVDYVDYEDFEHDTCESCGMSKYNHIICDNFLGNVKKACDTCGRHLHDHQNKEIKNGKYPCIDFTKADNDSCMDCKYCIHTETYHMLNTHLFKMNIEKQQNIDKFNQLINMNYSECHPLYQQNNKMTHTFEILI